MARSEAKEGGQPSFPDRWELFEDAERVSYEDTLDQRHRNREMGFLFGTAGVGLYQKPDGRILYIRTYFAKDGCMKDEITIIDPSAHGCIRWDGLAPHYTDRGYKGHGDTWHDLGESGYSVFARLAEGLSAIGSAGSDAERA